MVRCLLILFLFSGVAVNAQLNSGSTLREVAWDNRNELTALGHAALEIRAADWKHAESPNFVYHFFNSFVATPVAVEAEFYYRYFAKELGRETYQWEKKSHIFIFEEPEDWAAFKQKAQLDPWTGGIHSAGQLFIIRNPAYKFKGHSLGHEVAHLVLHRFFGSGIPLWLNEGYAEYASVRAHAGFHRARGYAAKPHSGAIAPGDLLAFKPMLERVSYPTEDKDVGTFYIQSEKLVRFFCRESKTKFVTFLEGMSHGKKFESALWKAYGGRFASVDFL
jgi:hypothetical protein